MYTDTMLIISSEPGLVHMTPKANVQSFAFVVGFILATLKNGVNSQFNAINETKLVVFTNKVTWPVARNICLSEGGKLIEMSDTIKYNYVRNLLETEPWFTNLSSTAYEFWIGLYDIYPPSQLFTWTNSCQGLANDTTWFDVTASSTGSSCALSINQTATWISRDCGEKHEFLCEMPTEIPCEYEIKDNRVVRTYMAPGMKRVRVADTVVEDCTKWCSANSSCWATAFCNLSFLPPSCTYYITDNPSLVVDTFQITLCFLYSKLCIEATVNELTTIYPENIEMPDECSYSTPTSLKSSSTVSATIAEEPTLTKATTTTEEPTSATTTTEQPTSATTIAEQPTSKTTRKPTFAIATTDELTSLAVKTTTKKLTSMASTTTTESASTATTVTTNNAASTATSTTTKEPELTTLVTETNSLVENIPSSSCRCNCRPESNLTDEEKALLVQQIVESLTVNKTNLSSTRRKYISALDSRESARYVGAIGPIILSVFFILVFLFDLNRFVFTFYAIRESLTKSR